MNIFTSNEEVQKIGKKHPRIISFFKQRFDRTKFSGLPLTIFAVAFGYSLLLFLGIIEDFITSDIMVNVDVRVNTLLYAFRTLSAVKFFIWITVLGEFPTVMVLTAVTSMILWLYHKRWQVVTLWLTVIGSEGCTYVTKILFHRPRPLNAVFFEDSHSFPSGHATIAVALYGFLTYLLIGNIKKKKYKVLITLFALILMLTIGFSRLYLGVHYVSDVLAGYLVGLLGLIMGISITEWKLFQVRKVDEKKTVSKHAGLFTAGLVSVGIAFYIAYGFNYRPPLTLKTPEVIVSNFTGIFTDGKAYVVGLYVSENFYYA